MSSKTGTSTKHSYHSMKTPVRVLTALARARYPLSMEDLGLDSGASAAELQAALRILVDEGLAEEDSGTGRYIIGVKFLRLQAATRDFYQLERGIRPLMRELAQVTRETVTLNLYEAGTTFASCRIVEESPSPLHYAVEVGEHKPLHAGSSGKVILAFLPDSAIEEYIERTGLPLVTRRTITTPDRLWRELRKIRKQGYSLSRGHRLDGAVAIAGPVFHAEDAIYASLVMTTPAYRFSTADKPRLVRLVVEAADQISKLIQAGNP